MYVGVTDVRPLPEYKLLLTFENNEQRVFDVKPYLTTGLFAELKDLSIFSSVIVSFDSVEWPNGADVDPEVLYSESISTHIDPTLTAI
jgi:hypothetical protein